MGHWKGRVRQVGGMTKMRNWYGTVDALFRIKIFI